MTRFAVRDVVAVVAGAGYEVTEEQEAVIAAPREPAVVVAGAGSGKTQTMSLRIAYLVANGLVEPDQILGLTFTRKAAGELAERVRTLLGRWWRVHPPPDADALPTVATYNSYAASLVRDHALRIGRDPDAQVLSEAGRWQLAHEVVTGFDFAELPGSAVSTLTGAVLRLSDAVAEHLQQPQQVAAALRAIAADLVDKELGPRQRTQLSDAVRTAASLRLRATLMDVVERYRERKAELGVMDFADQVRFAGQLARLPAVRSAERSRFAVVILDEYQDTSVAQLEFLAALFGGGHAVMAVGDPNQSIYGWRGASAGGLELFRSRFVLPDGSPAHQLDLTRAWRNDAAILAAANVVAEPLRREAGLVVQPLALRDGAGPGLVQAAYPATVTEETEFVADWISGHWRSRPDGSHPSVAVLCRKRKDLEPFALALRQRGLPVEVVGIGGLLSQPEVVDIVAALRAAHDPTRGDALMRLLTSARLRLGVADIVHLGDWGSHLARLRRGPAGGERDASERTEPEPDDLESGEPDPDEIDERSIVEAIESLPPPGWQDRRGHELTAAARERMSALAGTLAALRRLAYLPVADLVAQSERLLGIDIELAARGGPSSRVHVDRLVEAAEQFAQQQDLGAVSLGAFLDWLDAAEEHDQGLEPGEVTVTDQRIQLLTVHQAKGLEWDVVVVPSLVDGSLPATAAKGSSGDNAWLTNLTALPYPLRGDRDQLPEFDHVSTVTRDELEETLASFRRAALEHVVAEERRVAYVAVTRARSHLLLTGSWWGATARSRREPSPFLDELVDAGCLVLDVADCEPAADESNPVTEIEISGEWPVDPLGERRDLLEAAAERVRAAMSGGPVAGEAVADGSVAGRPGPGGTGPGGGDLPEPSSEFARLADLLLAEDAERRQPGPATVALPGAASPTALARLRHDCDGFLRDLRRPVPRRPSVAAQRGTQFHQWVELQFAGHALVDIDDLAGGADRLDEVEATAELREAFLASEWAHRTPIAVEVDLVVPLDGFVLRARPDAVFADRAGVVVVDWKSGRTPPPAELAERELQLALYRLAWSTYQGIDQDRVRTAFFFAGSGETVYSERRLGPADIPVLLEGVG